MWKGRVLGSPAGHVCCHVTPSCCAGAGDGESGSPVKVSDGPAGGGGGGGGNGSFRRSEAKASLAPYREVGVHSERMRVLMRVVRAYV